jgi:hypothetical protein
MRNGTAVDAIDRGQKVFPRISIEKRPVPLGTGRLHSEVAVADAHVSKAFGA